MVEFALSKGKGVSMFEEDPFDRWCRTIVEICFLVTLLVTLLVEALLREIGYHLIYHVQIFGIRAKYVLCVVKGRVGFLCFAWYRRHIWLPLMLGGFMKVPTWTEIEAHRLQIIAQSGLDVPRSPELEKGLKQEQMGQHL